MSKFKVGDRVVVSTDRFGHAQQGERGKVDLCNDPECEGWLRVNFGKREVRTHGYHNDEQELINTYEEFDLKLDILWNSPLGKAIREEE